ncbi:helix-turn-helix transcriptional regulator [Propioniciclava coleopterorum]|uniref:Helix-turn-helix transcriptional regulator n=1 Tax=Propioniciclava coleopterorum TaxID=2714937 RepID=A0A6G7Y5D9_9ACTN|nr:AraC family transcriptional regulator [Propioniciclava coleopterorum]QIK72104.1 helix-turn-helix transcriptional regulator [Propioniciclava coleopterorum]
MNRAPARAVTPRGRQGHPDAHPVDELTWVTSGRVVLTIGRAAFTATPQRAVYVPAGVEHRVQASGRSAVVPVFLPSLRLLGEQPLDIPRTADLDRLAEPLVTPQRADDLVAAMDALLAHLRPWARTTMPPLPSEPRARRVAQRVLAAPHDAEPLTSLAAAAGVSARTLQRTFLSETGMPFTRWRARCRLSVGVHLLRGGASVAEAARASGYTPSAFIARYRDEFGVTPGREARLLRAP